jgi:succinoglycan biosynthesis transport protein ExoP
MRGLNRFDAVDVPALLGILKRGRRTIVVWTGLFAALGVTLNVVLPPVYRATVRLEIRKAPDHSPLTGQSMPSASYQSENMTMYTAAERIKDRQLLGEIATEFEPLGWIQSLPSPVSEPQSLSARLVGAATAAVKPKGPALPIIGGTLQSQVDWLQTIISVEPVNDTRLVDIRVEHHDPQAATTIADRLAQHFADDQTRRTADADTSGLVDLKSQIEVLRQRFESAETSEGPAVLQARTRTLSDAAVELNAEYLKIHSERVELEARLDRLAMAEPSSNVRSMAATEDGALNQVQRDLETCRQQLASARQVYKDKHPRIVALQSQLASLQEAFRAEQKRALTQLRFEYSVLQSREAEALASRNRNERDLKAAEQESEHAAASNTELSAQKDLYGMLVTRLEQSRVEELLRSHSVEIVNAATLAPHPVRPRKALNLAVCLLTGLLVGSGQVLMRGSSGRTVRTGADVEALLDLPLLGVIPKHD